MPAPVLPDPLAPIRVLIAPYNYAGQGGAWARSIDGTGAGTERVSARSLAISTGARVFPADLTVPATVFLGSTTWRTAWDEALGTYTHVMIESFGSLLGRGSGDALIAEMVRLRERGIRLALICHGSDIRSPSAHVARHAEVVLADWGDGVARLERAARTGARIIEQFDGPVYVSTPDLLDDVPGATWMPVVIDPEPWRAAAQARSDDGRLTVAHIPSSARMKGTQYIDPVCERLSAEKLIRFRSLREVVPTEMPRHIADADIVIDQLLIGSYGVAACEAMAAGRVVVGNVSDAVRSRVRDETGHELPIVQATRADLDAVLRRLAARPAEREAAAIAGRVFVDQVHSGTRTRLALAEFLAP